MRFLILIALIFQISCSRENSTSSKKNKLREINFKREELLKGEFNSLSRDVDLARFYLDQYEKLKLEVVNLNGKEIEPLNQLDQAFHLKHGEHLISFQKLIQNYEIESNHLQQILASLKADIDIINTHYKENLSSFNLCKQESSSNKNTIEKKRDKAYESIQKLKLEFDSLVNSAKSHRDSAATWKKKVAHSNWPPDKKKYAEKAKDHAEKAKSYAIKANSKYDVIIKSVSKINSELALKVESLNHKFSLCKAIYSQLSLEKKDLEELTSQYKETSDQLISINQIVNQLYSDNQVLLKDFDEFKLKRDIIIGSTKERLAERKLRFENAHEKNIKNYGPEYLVVYQRIADWLSKRYVDGKETADLLSYLKKFEFTKIKTLYKNIYDILELATDKKIATGATQINREIASLIYIEIGGIKIPSLPKISIELPKLPEIKIELPELPEIRIALPSFDLGIPELKLDRPKVTMSLPQLTLTHIFPNLTFELPELMHFKMDKPSLSKDIPELKIGTINWDISGDVRSLFNKIKSIKITLPSIEILRIEADVWNDIKNPEHIFKNTARESTKTGENLYRELGNGVKEIRKVYLQSKGVNFDKLMKELKKGVSVCREQKRLVHKQVTEIKTVVDLLQAKKLGLISDEEYSNRYSKMIKETQILQGYGLTLGGIGSLASSTYLTHLIFSLSATSASSTTIIVGKIGLIGIGVAATLNFMASSAQKELEKEHDKIKECSANLNEILVELQSIQNVFIQEEIEGKSLLAQVRKRIEEHQNDLFQIDFLSDDYLENLNKLEQMIHKDMLKFKQSAILLGDKQTAKLINDFLNSIGLEL
jgi:hypothetical protein